MVKIKYVNYGIGNTFKDRIEINSALKKHPKLHKKVLEHELRHSRGEKGVDLKERPGWQMYKFILLTPSTWIQFFPIWYKDKKIIYEKSLGAIWIISLMLAIFLIIAAMKPHLGLILGGIFMIGSLIILGLFLELPKWPI